MCTWGEGGEGRGKGGEGGEGGREEEERGGERGTWRGGKEKKKQSYIVLLMYIYWVQVGDRSSPFLHFVRACDPTWTPTELAGGTVSPGLPVQHSTNGGGREREERRGEERRERRKEGGREGEERRKERRGEERRGEERRGEERRGEERRGEERRGEERREGEEEGGREGGREGEERRGEEEGEERRGGRREGEREREREREKGALPEQQQWWFVPQKPELKNACLKTFLCPVLPTVSFLYHH